MIRDKCRISLGILLVLGGATQAQVVATSNAKEDSLPHLNTCGRREPVGDLLQNLSKSNPKGEELAWFQALPAAVQAEIIGELNRYALELGETVSVKSRIKDNYDMRWSFQDKKPQDLTISPPKDPSGKTKSLDVALMDCATTPAAHDVDDSRTVKVQLHWQPGTQEAWKVGGGVADGARTFSLTFNYTAAPVLLNRVVSRKDELFGIGAVQLLPDRRLRLSAKAIPASDVFLVVAGEEPGDRVDLKSGQEVYIFLPALIVGGTSYKYLGTHDEQIRLESTLTNHGIEPDYIEIVEVAPYDKLSENSTTQKK